MVKVSDGYKKIENVCVGDRVVCCDDENNLVESSVIYVAKRSIDQYAKVRVGNEWICAACDQRFYNAKNDSWISASELKSCDDVSSHTCVELIDKAIDVYVVGVAKYHNFFVTSADICVHNFVPVIVVAISAAFGSGAIEIAGISAGIAGLGTYLGYQWHKKNKQHELVMSSMTFDPSEETDGIYHAEDAQAPGMPTEKDGYHAPKKWDGKKKTHPINGKVGWPDKKGKIWVPSGVGPNAHGGPHWDVQYPNGRDYDNVYPGGMIR